MALASPLRQSRAQARRAAAPLADAWVKRQAEALAKDLEFVAHSEFGVRDWPVPQLPAGKEKGKSVAFNGALADGFSYDLGRLCETPLLEKEQEQGLFWHMNYEKYLACQLRTQTGLQTQAEIEAFEQHCQRSIEFRDHILKANTRLALSLACRYVSADRPLPDLFSEAMMSLIHAISKFDFERGNRFSTYATTAIRNNLHHFLRKLHDDRNKWAPVEESTLDAMADPHQNALQDSPAFQESRYSHLQSILTRLSAQERFVVCERFGLGGQIKPRTLRDVSEELGLSRERVRQIQEDAMDKLRLFAEEDRVYSDN